MRDSWWFASFDFVRKTVLLANWHEYWTSANSTNIPFALFANLIWIENCEFWTVSDHESRIVWRELQMRVMRPLPLLNARHPARTRVFACWDTRGTRRLTGRFSRGDKLWYFHEVVCRHCENRIARDPDDACIGIAADVCVARHCRRRRDTNIRYRRTKTKTPGTCGRCATGHEHAILVAVQPSLGLHVMTILCLLSCGGAYRSCRMFWDI